MRKVTVSLEKAQFLLATDAAKRKAHFILRWIASVIAAKQDLTIYEFEAQMATCWAFAKRTLSGVKSLLDAVQAAIEGPEEKPVCPEIEDDPNDLDLSALPANRRAFIRSMPAHMQADLVEAIANTPLPKSEMPLRDWLGGVDGGFADYVEKRFQPGVTACEFVAQCNLSFYLFQFADMVGVPNEIIEEADALAPDCKKAGCDFLRGDFGFADCIISYINR